MEKMKAKNQNYDGSVPYSVIFAVDDDTYIWKVNTYGMPERVHIPIGHMCIFAGDVIHAGDCFNKVHYRIHLYIDADLQFSDSSEERINSYMREMNQPIYFELVRNREWTANAWRSRVVQSAWNNQLPIEYDVVEYLLQERDALEASRGFIEAGEFETKLASINDILAQCYQYGHDSEVIQMYVLNLNLMCFLDD